MEDHMLDLCLTELVSRQAELVLYRMALTYVPLAQDHIVECNLIPLSFTVTEQRASNPQAAQPEEATRFTKRDAESVAASVRNSQGQSAKAVPLLDAVDGHIARLSAAIRELESLRDNKPETPLH